MAPGYIFVWHPPASCERMHLPPSPNSTTSTGQGDIPISSTECTCFSVLPLIYTGASLDWRLDRGSEYNRKAWSLCGMMRGVGGIRKSIHQSWLDKGLGLGLLCWGFKGVQVEIPSEEASTLQIGSVAFPAGQCTSPQLHPCHRLFDQYGHQDSSSPSL